MDYSFTHHAHHQLSKLPRNVQIRIIRKLEFYLNTPDPLHFSVPIQGISSNVYRFRIGTYRLIFEVLENRLVFHVYEKLCKENTPSASADTPL